MLNRLIKVVTNKPTEIDKPIFKKTYTKENKQIQELEALLKICNDKSKKLIEQDIKKLKYGQIGENNVYYELKNSYIPMICMHDLRVEYRGQTAQIDFIAITSKHIYIIECKNLAGDITISKEGEFIRYYKNSYGKVVSKEGMYSPYVQNERHINLIKEILSNELGYKQKLKRIESMIVVANPKTVINKNNAPKEISEKIIKYDQIIEKIKSNQNNKKIEWVFIEEDMIDIYNCLCKFQKESNIDYEKKYSLSVKSDEQINSIVNDEDLREALKSYRLKVSKEEGIKAFMVFSNDTMEDLIEKRPKNMSELKNIKGFGPVKCEKYGEDLLNITK